MSAQRIKASTQKFLEIADIKDTIVMLTGSRACIVLQVMATNFTLLSREEQDSRMFAYASLLNSLSFPVQIVIRNKRVQIEPYLKLLKDEADKTANPKLANFIRNYRDFVENLVKLTSVLDKTFYMVIPYTGLEAGASTAAGAVSNNPQDAYFHQAKSSLEGKAESLLGQLERIGLHAHILKKEELIKLFYELYNPENATIQQTSETLTQSHLVMREGIK